MATRRDNRWRALITMSSDHAGLANEFERLETEMYRVLARIDDARKVRSYLVDLCCESKSWLAAFQRLEPDK